MALHRPVHVARWPVSALTLTAFFIPPDAGGTELDTHRLRHHFHCVCVSVCAPYFLPPVLPRVNRVICEAHCDARTTVWTQRMLPQVNISPAEGSMSRLFPYSLVLSTFQIVI